MDDIKLMAKGINFNIELYEDRLLIIDLKIKIILIENISHVNFEDMGIFNIGSMIIQFIPVKGIDRKCYPIK